ncbi:MAG: hypothetical protein R3Y04_02850 [Rikenellaceae bacterium]
MEKKLVVKICTGTLCYITGGAELQMLDEYLTEDIQSKIHVIGSPCLEHCNKCEDASAPFVEVGKKVISGATIPKVVAAIKEQLEAK